MYIVFDTETTGLPKNRKAPLDDFDNWPRLVQLAWQKHDKRGKLIEHYNYIIKPDGFTIPFESEKIHGISTERANKEGIALQDAIDTFSKSISDTTHLVGHNVEFDIKIVGCEFLRLSQENILFQKKHIDTKDDSTRYVGIRNPKTGRYKWPTLTELHEKLFGKPFDDAHDCSL